MPIFNFIAWWWNSLLVVAKVCIPVILAEITVVISSVVMGPVFTGYLLLFYLGVIFIILSCYIYKYFRAEIQRYKFVKESEAENIISTLRGE